MSNLKLIHGSCADQNADAVVNAANSGIFGGNLPNPAAESAKQCGRAYKKFVQDYPDYEVDVMLCAYGTKEYQDVKNELGI